MIRAKKAISFFENEKLRVDESGRMFYLETLFENGTIGRSLFAET
jgi:hypothetical protein